MLHSDILCNLVALNVPNCAVKLIKSYLTQRSMCVRYRGAVSSFQSCPGGGPQGGLLTGALFCLQVNNAGRPCVITQHPSLGQPAAQPPSIVHESSDQQLPLSLVQDFQHPSERYSVASPHLVLDKTLELQHPSMRQTSDLGPSPPCHNKKKLNKKSFIDDLTLLENISLSNLTRKETIVGPLDWHDRFQLTLPANKSILQHQLLDLQEFSKLHHMKLNQSKTKCLPFINSKTRDFMPQLSLVEGTSLEVIYELKLVGLVVTSDLTWTAHVNYTVARVNGVLWQLTRFRRLGAPQEKLVTFYILKIR